jgi:hypothetical protein
MDSFLKLIATVLISSTLIACGGGGGGGGASSSGSSSQTPVSSDTPKTPDSNTPDTSDPSAKTVDITLSWVAPTTRENGDALLFSEINGYEIYYFKDGTGEENDKVVSIKDPNTVEATITDLTVGTYYFAIATLDTAGLYSDTSDYVELVID